MKNINYQLLMILELKKVSTELLLRKTGNIFFKTLKRPQTAINCQLTTEK